MQNDERIHNSPGKNSLIASMSAKHAGVKKLGRHRARVESRACGGLHKPDHIHHTKSRPVVLPFALRPVHPLKLFHLHLKWKSGMKQAGKIKRENNQTTGRMHLVFL